MNTRRETLQKGIMVIGHHKPIEISLILQAKKLQRRLITKRVIHPYFKGFKYLKTMFLYHHQVKGYTSKKAYMIMRPKIHTKRIVECNFSINFFFFTSRTHANLKPSI